MGRHPGHGDPRHYAEDISKLKAENKALRDELDRLLGFLGELDQQRYYADALIDWRSQQ